MNVAEGIKETLPRAIELVRLLFSATFVEADTSAETEEPVFPRDAYMICHYTLMYFVCAWTLRLIILRPFAKLSLSVSGDNRKLEKRTDKSVQSFLEAIEYGLFSYMGYTIIMQHDWSWPSHLWYGSKLHNGPGSQTAFKFQRKSFSCFYMLYVARYTSNLISVVFVEKHRKDFAQMVTHHIATMLLVGGSYFGGYGRVGSMIMLCMDPADVPLHIAKVIKYMAVDSKEKVVNPTIQLICDIMFGIFMLVFTFTRLVVFGYLCYSGTFESAWRWADKPLEWSEFVPAVKIAYDANVWMCIAALWVLYGLQVFWKSLIMRVLLKIIAGGSADDIRESDSDKND